MRNGNAPALEMMIDSFSCQAVVTEKGRIEFRLLTSPKTLEEKKALLTKMGAVIRQTALYGLPEGVLAQMAGTRANPRNFCKKLVQGFSAGDLVVYHVISHEGRFNHVNVQSL